jgi:hypothetical protein
MSEDTKVLSTISDDTSRPSKLLQLPETALDLVLQLLTPCSLASTAVACSRLRKAAPAHISEVVVRCRTVDTFHSANLWLAQHSSSLTRLVICGPTCVWGNKPKLNRLPCPQLRDLHLENLEVESVNGLPSVLQDCSRLTALDLQHCKVHGMCEAMAALPQLQHLDLTVTGHIFPNFKHPQKLTHLKISATSSSSKDLAQLSTLVNLEHLTVSAIPREGVLGGWPSQLVKLTHLHASYYDFYQGANQFQHLSCLTALQDLAVKARANSDSPWIANTLMSGLQHLDQLTNLSLEVGTTGRPGLELSAAIINNWDSRTALQSLSLAYCYLEPNALATLPQLEALSVTNVTTINNAPPELLLAVSQLTMLTELCWSQSSRHTGAVMRPAPAAAAFTALTASSDLCSLTLHWLRHDVRDGHSPVLFQSGGVHPHLRVIDLYDGPGGAADTTTISEQQLQLLCSSCPAVESLAFMLDPDASPTAWLPLLQLSALTNLRVGGPWVTLSDPDSAAVDVAVQLTGLRELQVEGIPDITDAALLQLTALTALTKLTLTLLAEHDNHGSLWQKKPEPVKLSNQVSTRQAPISQCDKMLCAEDSGAPCMPTVETAGCNIVCNLRLDAG